MNSTESASRERLVRTAVPVAGIGAVFILLCLYMLPWWGKDAFGDADGFMDLARETTDAWGTSSQMGPQTRFGTMFYEWGHIAFMVVAVVAVVALAKRWWQLALGASAVLLFCEWWMRKALGEPGVINTRITAQFHTVGVVLIVAAAVAAAFALATAGGRPAPPGAAVWPSPAPPERT